MAAGNTPPGFHGKLPGFGDFLSRRLPRTFIDPWEAWVQSGLAASREHLGTEWVEIYLTSPIWRFLLSPGICGQNAWAGVIMPSMDRVHRYFPMTIAVPVERPSYAAYLFDYASEWFENLEQLALQGLDDGLDINGFDLALQKLELPDFLQSQRAAGQQPEGMPAARRAWRIDMEDLSGLPSAWAGLANLMFEQTLPLYSIWATSGSERAEAALMVCDGLPPVDGFTSLMTGHWQQRGWSMQSDRIPGGHPAPDEITPINADDATIPPTATSGAWQSYGISVVGNRRKINEDAFLARPEIGLWVVADGMGGHQAGDVASRSIVDALASVDDSSDLASLVERVKSILTSVNDDLHRMGTERLGGQVVGSTVVALIIKGSRCAVIWAGDSRLYRFRAGRLEQITQDHSLLDELVKSGFMTVEQMAQQGNNNIITRAVGAEEGIDLETLEFKAQNGDTFVLCSDGLIKELSEQEIVSRLQGDSCSIAAQSLIDSALASGGRDNISVIVIRAPAAG